MCMPHTDFGSLGFRAIATGFGRRSALCEKGKIQFTVCILQRI